MPTANSHMTIGEAARRTGLATSALRFYEQKGLISSWRSSGGQRQYHRSMLRRISLIRVAQTLGISLREIGEVFESLPNHRTPTRRDWTRLSRNWKQRIEDRISQLENLRDQLDGCIGCGCLSLKRCALYNPDDSIAVQGAGPRFMIARPEPKT